LKPPGWWCTQFLPLKANVAGVMPIIFAQAILFLPTVFSGSGEGWAGILQIMYQHYLHACLLHMCDRHILVHCFDIQPKRWQMN
jgi:preprotein translocase subunit SecY